MPKGPGRKSWGYFKERFEGELPGAAKVWTKSRYMKSNWRKWEISRRK